MNVQQMVQLIADKQLALLENAYLEAIEAKVPPAELAKVLEALVAAEQLDLAEALGAPAGRGPRRRPRRHPRRRQGRRLGGADLG